METNCRNILGHVHKCRSQWPNGLRRGSAATRLSGSWDRIPPGQQCLSLESVVCCQVEISASGWSLVQRSPTECGVSECDSEALIMRRPWPTRGLLGLVDVLKLAQISDRIPVGHLQTQITQIFLSTLSILNKRYYLKCMWKGIRRMCSVVDPSVETVVKGAKKG